MPPSEVLCVIPARLESTRLPRKLLRTIDGKPLIQFTYEHAKQAKSVGRVLVACDHESIKHCVESFGGEAILTGTHHTSGTERIAEVARKNPSEIIVNLQGDEPLMRPEVVDQVVGAIQKDPACQMSSACIRKKDPAEFVNPNVVKTTKDRDGYALYFSRSPIPHDREKQTVDYFKHLGIYGYRRDFLLQFVSWGPSLLEAREKLEQLRVLENGFRIKLVETVYDSIGVDTEEDLKMVQEQLAVLAKTGASYA